MASHTSAVIRERKWEGVLSIFPLWQGLLILAVLKQRLLGVLPSWLWASPVCLSNPSDESVVPWTSCYAWALLSSEGGLMGSNKWREIEWGRPARMPRWWSSSRIQSLNCMWKRGLRPVCYSVFKHRNTYYMATRYTRVNTHTHVRTMGHTLKWWLKPCMVVTARAVESDLPTSTALPSEPLKRILPNYIPHHTSKFVI